MTYEEMEKLARTGDVLTEAIGFRLRAARQSIRPKVSQKEMAERMGQVNTTYATWETGKAYPQIYALRYFYLNHRIDFNFLLYDSFSQLPGDVKDALFEAMQALALKPRCRSNSRAT